MAEPRALPRVSTGVPGLDTVLAGGLFEASVYIVQGPPGAGKTILANQICFHQAAQQHHAVYYTLLAEAHDRMMGFLQPLSFFDPAAIPKWVSYVSGFHILESQGVAGVVRNLGEHLSAQRPTVLVIDGVATAAELAPSRTELKKLILELQTLAAMFRTTILLLASTDGTPRLPAEHTIVDGIIELGLSVVRLKPRRSLQVLKLRGAAQVRGTHTLEIGANGVTVLPRLETLLTRSRIARPALERERRTFDVPALDAMLHGGLLAGSSTMLLGPSGAGKTLLALHFMAAGAAAGEPGLYITFYEQPEDLIAKAERLGLTSIAPAVERGALRIAWQSTVEANLDRIGRELIAAWEETHPTRVALDGLHGLQVTEDPPERIHDILAAANDYLSTRGVTLAFTVETPELLGDPVLRVPFTNASRLCHNILAVRFRRQGGRLRRVLAIIKQRDSDFDPTLRELLIGERGIELGDPIADAPSPGGSPGGGAGGDPGGGAGGGAQP